MSKKLRLNTKVGKKFGRLTVIEELSERKSCGSRVFLCECECGNTAKVRGSHLHHVKGQGTKSCGCQKLESSRRNVEKMKRKGDHLYIVQCGDYFKIGSTSNWKVRLRQMKVNNPYPLELIYYGENEGHKEFDLHEQYKDQHHSGEWYSGKYTDAG